MFCLGCNGLPYLVFKDTDEAWDYAADNDLWIASFDGYENAVLLQMTIGM